MDTKTKLLPHVYSQCLVLIITINKYLVFNVFPPSLVIILLMTGGGILL